MAIDAKFLNLVKQVVQDQGIGLFNDPRGCKAALDDLARGEYAGEIRLLHQILEAGAYKKLCNKNQDLDMTKEQLVQYVCKTHFLDMTSVRKVMAILIDILGIKTKKLTSSTVPEPKPNPVRAAIKPSFSAKPSPKSTPVKVEGFNIDNNGVLLRYTGSGGNVVIPEGVRSISKQTFFGNTNLISITFPSSITSIGESAFYNCTNLICITFPSSIVFIGAHAFYGCSRLTSITIPSSVTSIWEHTFADCSRLTNVTIPSSVTSIEDYAFYGCSRLTSITIPSSVTFIGEGAFFGCTSLASVTILSSVISIGATAFSGCTSLTNIPSSVTSFGQDPFLKNEW